MKKKSYPVVHMGTASMLISFIGLCMGLLAALSLASAKSDYELTRKMAQQTTVYYEACNTAEKILLEQVEDFSFEVPIKEGQVLRVTGSCKGEKAGYEITEWKEINTEEWNLDTVLPVMP